MPNTELDSAYRREVCEAVTSAYWHVVRLLQDVSERPREDVKPDLFDRLGEVEKLLYTASDVAGLLMLSPEQVSILKNA